MSPRAEVSKTLSNPADQQEILLRLSRLSPHDKGLWGRMTVHEAVCHMQDSYLIPLGEKLAEPALSRMPGLVKRLALYTRDAMAKGSAHPAGSGAGQRRNAAGRFCDRSCPVAHHLHTVLRRPAQPIRCPTRSLDR